MASMATPDSGESNLLSEPRSVRQETTMARAGTLLNFLYQRSIVPRESVDLTGDRSEDKDGYETCRRVSMGYSPNR